MRSIRHLSRSPHDHLGHLGVGRIDPALSDCVTKRKNPGSTLPGRRGLHLSLLSDPAQY
jgi:hypothetical protein